MTKSQAWPNTFRIPLLESVPGLACVFVGRGAEPRPQPDRLAAALGIGITRAATREAIPVATARQIHSDRCLVVSEAGNAGEGDALLTDRTGIALGIATADCLPLVAVDPDAGALAAIHAGWRGTLSGILGKALHLMVDRLGAAPRRIRIGAGAAAGACCYEVGPEVAEAFTARAPDCAPRILRRKESGRLHLDLLEANFLQALEVGVRSDHLDALGICTVCRPDVCHSYRRDGAAAGRMWLMAALV